MSTKPTVLITDDDRVSQALLRKMVAQLGYEVVVCDRAEKAYDVIAKREVALVISDYTMPGLSGLDLLRMVKAKRPSLPFILITAYSNFKVIREAWDLGAFDFFQKPVSVERLHQTIRLAVEFGHLAIARRKFTKMEQTPSHEEYLDISVIRELAAALERNDLLRVVEEFETHARIELEQLLRFSVVKNTEQVGLLAHRLGGTALNLGLVKFNRQMLAIEAKPTETITDPTQLAQDLDHSIYWLKTLLPQIFQDLAS